VSSSLNNGESRSTCCRKNITFSYSNKDLKLNDKIMMRECNRKCSSIATFEDVKNDLSKVLTLKKEFTFGNNLINRPLNDQTSSLKVIYPIRRADKEKKYSFFQPPTNTTPEPAPPFKIQKLTDYFSKYKALEQEPRRIDVCRFPGKDKPELLHYSTSTNPYKKYGQKKTTDDKSISSFDQMDNSSNNERKGKENTGRCGQSEIINEMYESGDDKRGAQEIKRDLDALFDSSQEYDEQELEDELGSILF
jgi:hypothetical protein